MEERDQQEAEGLRPARLDVVELPCPDAGDASDDDVVCSVCRAPSCYSFVGNRGVGVDHPLCCRLLAIPFPVKVTARTTRMLCCFAMDWAADVVCGCQVCVGMLKGLFARWDLQTPTMGGYVLLFLFCVH